MNEKEYNLESVVNSAKTQQEAYRAQIQARLESAKANLPADKERFEINKFVQLYDLTDDKGQSIVTPELVFNLEIQYYLKYAHLKTLADFANYRDYLDANQG